MLSQSVGNARETYAKRTTGAEKGAGAVEEVIQLAPSGVLTAGEMAMKLVPELVIWSGTGGKLLAGRADAMAYEGAAPTVVLDWKSDVRLTAQDRAQYRGQLQEYKSATGASRGAIVYMSLGEIAWV